MNHPTHEELVTHLYGELSGPRAAEVKAHLAACPDCQGVIATWRGTTKALDTWEAPAKPRRRTVEFMPVLRWAAAAAVVLGLGITIGRSSIDTKAMRSEIETAVKSSLAANLRQQVDNDMTKLIDDRRAEDRQNLATLLRQMEARRLTDYMALRRDLETVAVSAQDEIDSTQQQLGRLVSYTQPQGVAPNLDK